MAAPWVIDLREQGLVLDDWDAPVGTALLTPGGGFAQVFGNAGGAGVLTGLNWPTRPFYKAAIAYLGQAWDSGGNGNMTWNFLVNGGQVYPFSNQSVQFSPPFGDTNYLPEPFWLPQGAFINFTASLAAAASGNVNFTARVIVYYFRQDKNLQRAQIMPGYSHVPQGILGKPTPLKVR